MEISRHITGEIVAIADKLIQDTELVLANWRFGNRQVVPALFLASENCIKLFNPYIDSNYFPTNAKLKI